MEGVLRCRLLNVCLHQRWMLPYLPAGAGCQAKTPSFYFKLAIYRERLNFRDEMMNFEVSDWCGFKAVVKTSAGGFLLFNCQIQQVHTQK